MSGSGISWAACKSAPRSRQITTPAPHHSDSYRPDALPAAQPTASKHCIIIIIDRQDGKRPDGLTLIPWHGGRSLVWDVTVVSPLAASYVDRAATDAGTVTDMTATRKTEILDPVFSIQVRAYSSRKPWRLQFHNSELYFRTQPPNLCSHRRCERNFVPIPTHFYHATTLQLRAFAQHSAS